MLQIHLLAKLVPLRPKKGQRLLQCLQTFWNIWATLSCRAHEQPSPLAAVAAYPLVWEIAHPGPSLFLFKNKRSRFFKNCSRGVFVIINVILGNVTMLLKVHFRFVILGRCNMRRKPCGDVRQYSPTPPSQVWSPHYRQDLQTKNVQNGLLSQVFFGAWKLWRVLKKTATVPGLY